MTSERESIEPVMEHAPTSSHAPIEGTAHEDASGPSSVSLSAPSASSAASPAATGIGAPPGARKRVRSTKGLSRAMRVDDADLVARRRAACVLEVLAGVRTPEDAALMLELSLAGYFQLEERALRGVVESCGSHARGPSPDVVRALDESRRRVGDLEREVQRHQALLRSAQRAAGLLQESRAPRPSSAAQAAAKAQPPSKPPSSVQGRHAGTKAPGGSGRRPKIRALRAVDALRAASGGVPSAGQIAVGATAGGAGPSASQV